MLNYLAKSKGLLGMNSRNLEFVRPYNAKSAVNKVNDKLATKRLLKKEGLPIAELYAVIKNRQELYSFDLNQLPKSFALKPNMGFGGEGILITYGRKKNNNWVMTRDRELSAEQLFKHVSDILDGSYSYNNIPDVAFFEQRLKIHPAFKLYTYKGVPDIRVIVFNKAPVMAMLRLPTKSSDGKANLHQGGIGLGIDIKNGITTNAIQYDREIEYLPESKIHLRAIKIPYWDDILNIASEAATVCNLGYSGVDIAIDKETGPVILEVNAHPGLSIQNANQAPLKERLIRVKGLKIKDVKKGLKVAKELFGGEIETEVEEITGKQVIGLIEEVSLFSKNNDQIKIKAKVDTGAGVSSIDEDLAITLGFLDAVNYYKSFAIKDILTRDEINELSAKKTWKTLEKHPDICGVVKTYSSHGASYRIEVPIKFIVSGYLVNSKVSIISRSGLAYPMIIGRRDLKRFLVDPTKKNM